jgi:hypothetical protein
MAAVRGTLIAIVMFAVLAVVTVLRAHRASAVIAGRTLPLVKGYVRAVRTVGIQDAPDNSEKVRDPAIFKSSSNRSMTIPFTELFTTNVRMCNFLVCGRRMRFESDYKVRGGVVHLFELIQL